MRKESIMQLRVATFHRERMQELAEQTGLTSSEIVRRLIENAAVVMRPTLGATISVEQNKTAQALAGQGGFAN